ncbi:CGNR zinc finger domain-containing protein [Nonomuraea sp. NEAU-A123]|uniref:CGNR zinc finger domain-containing protein n=1 Tax=Nonomuraea sp. NEAU-A123 TaxID=2839649 RepID=UPI001BE470BE|nr:CGNR zinc finger domain-containing protein [Nonomuraea sp. NEAU-A123]MBT2234051.1 CGNR zinc finger domain-containing protein [Nonomuraea sp. NEAU-A123]
MLAPAELVRDFVNTYDLDSDADELASPAELAVWLRERGLIGPRDRATDDDLTTALTLREALRAALRRETPELRAAPRRETPELRAALSRETPKTPEPRAGLRRETPEMPELPTLLLLVRVGATPELVPLEEGVRGGLARITAAVTDQSWHRLKVCAEGLCQWAFIDSSKNRSRSWCSMRVCGNRTKTRAYRARKQGSRHPQGSNTDTV